jgi:cytochrome c-type biogenesis protein CcmF
MKDSTYKMSGYDVTYTGRTDDKHEQIFNVNYRKLDKEGKAEVENFTLTPNIVHNKKMGDSPNPSTKHYLSKDVFTHVTAASDNSNAKDTTILSDVAVGDTFYLNKYFVVFESINPHPHVEPQDKDKLAVQANLTIKDLRGNSVASTPVFFIDVEHGNETSSHAFDNEQWGVSIDIARINPETKKFSFIIHQKELQQEFIILKAIVFPYINLVWLGGIITFLGIFISAWRRRN